jgi:hypothetical protein
MLVNNYNSILKRKSSNWQPETITQKNRIEADGGVVIDLPFMNRVIYTLKALGIYSNCKLLTDANFGVKKDITGAVSKLYDISGNNNDAIQATGASQPIWSLVGGKGVITYDGSNDHLSAVDSDDWTFGSGNFSIYIDIKVLQMPTVYYSLIGQGASGSNYWIVFLHADGKLSFNAVNGGVDVCSFTVPFTPQFNVKYNISIIRNGNTWYLYINDTPMTKTLTWGSYSNSLGNNAASLDIGRRDRGLYDLYLKGSMNKTIVFKGTALSQSQIATLNALGL